MDKIHYEGHGLLIYTNDRGALVVKNATSNAEIRFCATRDDLEFVTDSEIRPANIGVIAPFSWRLRPH